MKHYILYSEAKNITSECCSSSMNYYVIFDILAELKNKRDFKESSGHPVNILLNINAFEDVHMLHSSVL